MTTVDPTYPFYSISSIASSGMLLLVLLTSIARQNWNLGVSFLCIWLFLENLTYGINHILWADNADIKLHVYCDIVSRIQVGASVVRPMATLIITRRLYLIVTQRAVGLTDSEARRKNLVIEWILGFVIPVLVMGPLYYIVQMKRFQVDEGFGCIDAPDMSVLGILLFWSWRIIPPLLSVCVYYPRVARVFYRHNREINRFLRSNDSVSRTHYFRVLALASIDVVLTLPMGIVSIVLIVIDSLAEGNLPWYSGWSAVHSDWEPTSYSYAAMLALGTPGVVQPYFEHWAPVTLALIIFGLFGVTAEARASYWRVISTVGRWFGWKPAARVHKASATLGTIKFVTQRSCQDLPLDSEGGYRSSFDSPSSSFRRTSQDTVNNRNSASGQRENLPDSSSP